MAKRRVKKRTQQPGMNPAAAKAASAGVSSRNIDRTPKSMVIRVGSTDVGGSVKQLVKDMRLVMEPDTASRLKERKKNRLRDFTTMAGPLGVTHFMLFSRSEKGSTNLRIAITPRGPTLCFRVENYSLCKDIMRAHRRFKGFDGLHLTAPLLIMNNFMTRDKEGEKAADRAVPKHLESLVTTVFQSLFPPVSPQTMPLSSVKRVLLLNREPTSDPDSGPYTITLRHYAITTKQVGLTKAIKRINNAEKVHSAPRRGKSVPNLSGLQDVADYMLDEDQGNYTSASESEAETDAEVDVIAPRTRKLQYRENKEKKQKKGGDDGGIEKRAIKLSELGPRMKLRLVKIQDGMCDGKVMWHEYIDKSKEEVERMDAVWEKRNKEREERRRQQRENVERKRKERAEKGEPAEDDEDELDDEDLDDYEDWEDDDADVMDENEG